MADGKYLDAFVRGQEKADRDTQKAADDLALKNRQELEADEARIRWLQQAVMSVFEDLKAQLPAETFSFHTEIDDDAGQRDRIARFAKCIMFAKKEGSTMQTEISVGVNREGAVRVYLPQARTVDFERLDNVPRQQIERLVETWVEDFAKASRQFLNAD